MLEIGDRVAAKPSVELHSATGSLIFQVGVIANASSMEPARFSISIRKQGRMLVPQRWRSVAKRRVLDQKRVPSM